VTEANDRLRQRLKADLELDEDAIEVILNLHNQIMALQTRLQELESRMQVYQVESEGRFARYRETYFEAVWKDILE